MNKIGPLSSLGRGNWKQDPQLTWKDDKIKIISHLSNDSFKNRVHLEKLKWKIAQI